MKKMKNIIAQSFKNFQNYWLCQVASIAISSAFVAPVVIGSAGFALDYAQAYLVQQRLVQAIDAAALAGAAASQDEAVIEQKVLDFFAINYPPDRVGFTIEPKVTVTDRQVQVQAKAYLNTSFLRVLGIDKINVDASTTVNREIQAIEVVLVLDNTGSMASNNNIKSLKQASTNFINIMFDNATNEELVRIGIVPYSNSVRIGSYGLGKNPDGSTYGDGDVFVTLPNDVVETNSQTASSGWFGCVVENHPAYSTTATYQEGSKGQLWRNGTGWAGHGWDVTKNTNDPYPMDVFPDLANGETEYEGPWDIYQFGTQSRPCIAFRDDGTCRTRGDYIFTANSRPNQGCPYAQIVPLSNDRDFLLDQVDPDDANIMKPDGNTLGNIGMLWGGRVISPEAPFTEAQDWDSEYWRKAIVMMTDGDNTENGTYSSFWFTNRNNMNVTKFNQRFEETCENLKAMGVTIYTVTFTSGINDDTKGYYKRCATSEDQYFDAPTQADLEAVFEKIARELSILHISE
jgi:Flp pilus assembly protein TadG